MFPKKQSHYINKDFHSSEEAIDWLISEIYNLKNKQKKIIQILTKIK